VDFSHRAERNEENFERFDSTEVVRFHSFHDRSGKGDDPFRLDVNHSSPRLEKTFDAQG
jgi:hypothetical protein